MNWSSIFSSITSFLSTSSIKIAIFSIIFLGISGFVYDYANTKSELEAKRVALLHASSEIEAQNEAIKKLEVNISSYKAQKPKIIEKIVTKYKEVEVKDTTCEEKLETLQQYTKLFFQSKVCRKTKGLDYGTAK